MLGTTFYNESIRKALVSFGTLFNNITIQRVDSSNNTQNILSIHPHPKFIIL